MSILRHLLAFASPDSAATNSLAAASSSSFMALSAIGPASSVSLSPRAIGIFVLTAATASALLSATIAVSATLLYISKSGHNYFSTTVTATGSNRNCNHEAVNNSSVVGSKRKSRKKIDNPRPNTGFSAGPNVSHPSFSVNISTSSSFSSSASASDSSTGRSILQSPLVTEGVDNILPSSILSELSAVNDNTSVNLGTSSNINNGAMNDEETDIAESNDPALDTFEDDLDDVPPSSFVKSLFSHCSPDDEGVEFDNLVSLLHNVAEIQSRKDGFVHRGITCNNCNKAPIRGIRFRCANCIDFDLCEQCEEQEVHNPTHVFIKLRVPIPPLANPRYSMLPVFYPGTLITIEKKPTLSSHTFPIETSTHISFSGLPRNRTTNTADDNQNSNSNSNGNSNSNINYVSTPSVSNTSGENNATAATTTTSGDTDLGEDDKDVSKIQFVPLNYQQMELIQRKTHFDKLEAEALYIQFKSLAPDARGIPRSVFNRSLGPLGTTENLICDRIFRFFDANGDSFITFDEFARGCSVLCKGTMEEKIEAAFHGFDLERKGCISKESLYKMFNAYFNISGDLVRDIVRVMELEMINEFDSSSTKPISSSFTAPIPERPRRIQRLYSFSARRTSIMPSPTLNAGSLLFSPLTPNFGQSATSTISHVSQYRHMMESYTQSPDPYELAINSPLGILTNNVNNLNSTLRNVAITNSNITRTESITSFPGFSEESEKDAFISNSDVRSNNASSSVQLMIDVGVEIDIDEMKVAVSDLAFQPQQPQQPQQADLKKEVPSKIITSMTQPIVNQTPPTVKIIPQVVIEHIRRCAASTTVERIYTAMDVDGTGNVFFNEFKAYVEGDPSLITWFEALGSVF